MTSLIPRAGAGRRLTLGAVLLFSLALACSPPVAAASPPDPTLSTPLSTPLSTSLSAGDAATDVARADAALHEVARRIGPRSVEPAEVGRRLAELAPIQSELADAVQALEPRLADLNARLAQLGPPQPRGSETPEIVSERRALESKRRDVDGTLKQARLLSVEADQISSLLSRRLTQRIEAQFTLRSRSVVDPQLWIDVADSLPGDLAHVRSVLVDQSELTLAAARGGGARSAGLAIAAVLALVLAAPFRLWSIADWRSACCV